jgi:5-methylcytosine-specific restriction endonuclease McrA
MFDVFINLLSVAIVSLPFFVYYIYIQNKKGDESKRNRNSIHNLRRGAIGYRLNSRIYTTEERKRVLSFTEGRCFYCMVFLNSSYWEIDHLWPKKLKGVDDLFNLVASCKKCNKWKGTQNPFYHLVQKWSQHGYLNDFQIKFLEYYTVNSPSRLTTNVHWTIFMDEASKNIKDFLGLVRNNPTPTQKEKQEISNKYRTLFFDRPPSKTRWDRS